jgi:hypothetical protein
LEANGFRPLLALIVRGRQPLQFIRSHVEHKWSVGDGCVAINPIEFYIDATLSPALDMRSTIAELSEGSLTLDLFYSWSLKIAAPLSASKRPSSSSTTTTTTTTNNTNNGEVATDAVDNSKRARLAPAEAVPAEAVEPERAFAALFTATTPSSATVPPPPARAASSSRVPVPPPPPPQRPSRQAVPLLSELSRDVPLPLLGFGSPLRGSIQADAHSNANNASESTLDMIGGNSRSQWFVQKSQNQQW